MASWDRASPAYIEDWLPRFAPYHADLANELGLRPKQHVQATPDLEPFVLRAVGEHTHRAPFDAIVSTSADIDPGWSDALAPAGKVGLLLWGPEEPDDPLAVLERIAARRTSEPLDRSHLAERLHAAGLALVRHTVVRHTLMFAHAEELAASAIRASTWKAAFEAQGEARCGKALARFYDEVGGPQQALSWEPAATIVIAGLPGAEIELPHRPSVKIPLS